MAKGLYVAVLVSCCLQYLIKGQTVDITTPNDNSYTFVSNHGFTIGTSTSVVFGVVPSNCNSAYILLAKSTSYSGYFLTVVISPDSIRVYNFKSQHWTTFNSGKTLIVCGHLTPFKISWDAASITTYRMEANTWIAVYTYHNTNHGVVSQIGIKTVSETGQWRFEKEQAQTTTITETSTTTTTTEKTSTQTTAMTSQNMESTVRSSPTPTTTISDHDTTPTTSLLTDTSTSPSPGLCQCNCSVFTETASLESLIAALRKELLTNKKDTSLYKRSLTSATDDRTSSKSIGYVGIAILACVFGGIVALDLKYIVIIAQSSARFLRSSRQRSSKVTNSCELTLK